MLDINLIREQPDSVRESLKKRQMDATPVDEILRLDVERRNLLTKVEALKAERNTASKEISKIKDNQERQKKIESMRTVGDEISSLDGQLQTLEGQLQSITASIPNLPNPFVPVGVSEQDNVVVKTFGEIPSFDFTPLPHWDLGVKLGIIDFEQGIKLTGSRFYVLSGAGARLQRALIAWMLDLHIRQGYLEKYTPFIVHSDALFASGQLPKFAENLYHDVEEDFWLVPTAEVPLTGLHMG
ncbi:serine--tRNA ligase, partial [bacterium]|nr:serine--tRNA ligase [bacterium]